MHDDDNNDLTAGLGLRLTRAPVMDWEVRTTMTATMSAITPEVQLTSEQ